VKREFVLKKDTIPQIIADARNQVVQSSFEGFTRYSVKRFDDCLAGRPIYVCNIFSTLFFLKKKKCDTLIFFLVTSFWQKVYSASNANGC